MSPSASAATPTVGERIAEALARLGVRRVHGVATGLGGLPGIAAPDDLALLLADLDGRCGGVPGVALLDPQLLHVSSQPGGRANPETIADPETALLRVHHAAREATPHTIALHLDFDLDAPAPIGFADLAAEADPVVSMLSPDLAQLDVVFIAGPGVVRAGVVDRLHVAAAHAGVPVFNTCGAKGVFRWDSPYHAGTIGLQERDAELAGITNADLVVVVGGDPAELDLRLVAPTVLEVEPAHVDLLVARWAPAPDPPARTRFFSEMSAAVTPLYESESSPLSPARAALHLSGAAPRDGVVVADAGVAGFWLARTFPTGIPASMLVPAIAIPGAAVAAALLAGLDDRPCVAVCDAGATDGAPGGLDPRSAELLELASTLGCSIAVQVWEPACNRSAPPVAGSTSTGVVDSAAAHVEASRAAFDRSVRTPGVHRIDRVAFDERAIDRLVEVAGPVTAWGGSGAPGSGDS